MARVRTGGQPPYRIPPILFEGDESGAPAPARGPGDRRAPAPAAPVAYFDIQAAKLPETYGAQTLLLTALDPHRLYAHWDIAPREQRQYSALAAGQRLVLRVYERALSGFPAAEIHLQPDSRHWSGYVPRAETQYVAELGYFLPGGLWQRLATSQVAATPPDSVSQDSAVRFATFEPLAPATQPPGAPQAPPPLRSPPSALGPPPSALCPPPSALRPQPSALRPPPSALCPPPSALGPPPSALRSPPSALGPPPLQPQAEPDIGSQSARELGLPSLAGAREDITSPGVTAAPAGAGEELPREFWFNINAEVILYGATEPDAQVAIAGQPIRLRPDGGFSFRFALPDGDYDLVATAISAHHDQRQVRMQFSRRTD